MFFKLGVDRFMSNKKGTTLVEGLFAFEIYITVLILCLSLMSVLLENEKRIDGLYYNILQEEKISYSPCLENIVEKALHL